MCSCVLTLPDLNENEVAPEFVKFYNIRVNHNWSVLEIFQNLHTCRRIST
jgi:hypothetical protein